MTFWGVRLGSILLALGVSFLPQLLLGGADQSYQLRLVVLAALYVTLAVSLNLINGITGQFSIGHAAFYQVGAYAAGYLTLTSVQKGGQLTSMPWLIGMMLVGALAAAVAGLVVGLPSLRLRGDYLAIVTLGFGEIIRIVVQNQQELGGSYGMNVPKPTFDFVWLVVFLAIMSVAVCRNLLRTAHGLPFLAVREDEVASAAMGVNVTAVKVTAFVIGSAFAGAAGALFAHFEGFITPGNFAMDVSFIVLTMVVLGGTGSITGSVLAAIFLSYLPEWLRGLKDAQGNTLAVTGGQVVAALVATALVVAAIKWLMESHRGTPRKRAFSYLGLIAAGIVLTPLLAIGLNLVPQLVASRIEAGQLRMVIFSVTLIVLMLLRPQGVFAHHEFSWSWVRRVLGDRNAPRTEVAA
jgi:branched-chain amino acid transport system permease protein